MDVQLPDGTIISGVPEGTTRAQLDQMLRDREVQAQRKAVWNRMNGIEKLAAATGAGLTRAAAGVGTWAGLDMEQALKDLENFDSVSGGYGTAGDIVSDVMLAAPFGAAGALRGPLTALGSEAVAAGVFEGAKTQDAGDALTTTALTGVGGYAIPKLLGVTGSDAARELAEQGVKLTPGQMYGGIVKALENTLSYIPGTASGVRKLWEQAIESWNEVIRNGRPPQEAMTKWREALGAQYDRIFNGQITLTGIEDSLSEIALKVVDALPTAAANDIGEYILGLTAQLKGSPQGTVVQSIHRNLGRLSNKAAAEGDGVAADAYKAAQSAIQDAMPEGLSTQLGLANKEYANFKVVERAQAYAAPNRRQPAGTVTPGEVGRASAVGRRSATARGTAPLQQEARQAGEVLGYGYPGDQATDILSKLGPAAVAAEAVVSPPLAAATLAARGAITETGRRAINSEATRVMARNAVVQPLAQSGNDNTFDALTNLYRTMLGYSEPKDEQEMFAELLRGTQQ